MKYIAILSILLIFYGLIWSANAEDDLLNDNIVKLCQDLCSLELNVRENSKSKLSALKINEEQTLLNNLKDLMQKNALDTTHGSSFHYTVEMLGKLRVREAIPMLIKNIDFKIDELTVPDWHKKSTNSYYPVAVAISEIESPSVWFDMYAQLKEVNDEKVLTLYAWVLYMTYGPQMTTILLNDKSFTSDKAISEKIKKINELAAKQGTVIYFDKK